MNRGEFENNLIEVYNISDRYQKERIKFFSAVSEDNEKRKVLDDFLNSQNLPITGESRYSLASRLVSVSDNSLNQFLKKQNFEEGQIKLLREKAYNWTKEFYKEENQNFIEEIKNKELLTDFYEKILEGVHEVGIEMNELHLSWNRQISKINQELLKKFGTQENVMEYLDKNNLFDKGHYGLNADRSYSVLVNSAGNYEKKSYFDAFPETQNVILALEKFKQKILPLEDIVYNQKQEFLDYFDSLIQAFSEKNTDNLVSRWANVDEKWMKIKTPLQICHPLEYYDDAFRKAVSIEWDLRLQNFSLGENERAIEMKKMYDDLFGKIGNEEFISAYEKPIKNIERTLLFLSKPIMFYGSELNGLFSAQVIPNDNEISKKEGKKIFAFSDMILKKSRESPFTKFGSEIYEKEFLEKQRRFLFNETENWHKIYDFATIGHEYGHILWTDDDTEIEMNKTGNFKNIEEFKATMGGVMNFFYSPDNSIKKELLEKIVTRDLGLLNYIEEEDYRPYYCESLIHLKGFIDTGILSFDGEKIKIDVNSEEKYDKIKEWHYNTYEKLAKHYLEKKDASLFLNEYVEVKNNLYVSTNEKIEEIRQFIYQKYQEFGNQIDDSVKKEDYMD